jgi:L-ascorbate metabolism protein UlaG (beta-lactamase superfamily)
MIIRLFAILVSFVVGFPVVARAQGQPSECLAIAHNMGARFQYAALTESEARLTFVGHSTFLIESPGGIKIATDFAGWSGGVIPDVVTMNRAHTTHYTDNPDPAIKHVLRGWSDTEDAAQHDVTVGDVRIRNVTTDIRFGNTSRQKDANSIFVFEVAGLCIGHLGHLHHELTPEHIGWIGRLDVVMVPVDGRYTMPTENMMTVLKDIKARIIIPMHIFGPETLAAFVSEAQKHFKVEYKNDPVLVVSADTLPKEPTLTVLPGR